MISFDKLDVKIITRENEYDGVRASNGAPFYIRSIPKDDNTLCIVVLYLPITLQQFHKNNTDYFYGLHIMLKIDKIDESELEDDMMVMKHKRDINYDIRRIRFYPDGNRIIVDKINDSLTIPHGYVVESDEETCDVIARNLIHDIIDKMITFYHGKTI